LITAAVGGDGNRAITAFKMLFLLAALDSQTVLARSSRDD
jgi:hypothetical protein